MEHGMDRSKLFFLILLEKSNKGSAPYPMYILRESSLPHVLLRERSPMYILRERSLPHVHIKSSLPHVHVKGVALYPMYILRERSLPHVHIKGALLTPCTY